MFYQKKTGMPEESELVLCTVSQIQYHSIFVTLDEYQGLSGMIHISEVAPGRIRNIRDYVKEGKVIVCKVLRINRERGQLDLSLRRVTDAQRRHKVNQIKHEQKAESIVEHVSKELKLTPEKLYAKIKEPIFKEYDFLYEAFVEVVEKDFKLTSLGIEANIAAKLEETIRQRIKPKEVMIGGKMTISTFAGNGVEIIKENLLKVKEVEGAEVTYLGGGRYKFLVKSKEYKEAEAILEDALETASAGLRKAGAEVEFARDSK